MFGLCFVRSVDLDGGNRQVVATGTVYPRGITIYEEYVYWISRWGSYSGDKMIERANRFTGLNRQVIYNATGWSEIRHLRVNHPSKQPTS